MIEQGRITRGIGGFYEVSLSDNRIVTCKPRGRFRREGLTPLPGDMVNISTQENDLGRLEEILPRKNLFVRPSVANLDALVLVASMAPPKSTTFWIDRILAVATQKQVEGILVLNKTDVEQAVSWAQLYRDIGYTVVETSAVTAQGIETLRDCIAGKIVAFSGHSGVGKSSLLNQLQPDLQLPVGDISQKLGRGRHTTRHVELFPLEKGAWMADTPGFSAFEPEQLQLEGAPKFPEFEEIAPNCQFRDCIHIGVKGCAVAEAVAEGRIAASRFESYKSLVVTTPKQY